MAGEDPNTAVLDWFGVSVKAAEIPAHLQRMKTLARKVPSVLPSSLHQIPSWQHLNQRGLSAVCIEVFLASGAISSFKSSMWAPLC